MLLIESPSFVIEFKKSLPVWFSWSRPSMLITSFIFFIKPTVEFIMSLGFEFIELL